jgi:hypothetical protein
MIRKISLKGVAVQEDLPVYNLINHSCFENAHGKVDLPAV